ncbi:hypothetical protein FY034_17805 (plasmid) [Trichlorobacter lovleyi]|uniref:hypothetical protein n=1 Tax=Trichlorobacter lovleyi TaxID=313985 RepID=UPI002240C413|nr:hypothetical protein [Trichlorobacter lovleyi]QOX80877.1 hypothetical protein FY034_17805 [Trichlorobacter lovleyi]
MSVEALTVKAQRVVSALKEELSALNDKQKLTVLNKLSDAVGVMALEQRQKIEDDQDDKDMSGRPLSYLPPCPVCGKTDKLAVQFRFLRVPADGRATRVITQCVCRHDACFRSHKSGGNRYARPFVEGVDEVVYGTGKEVDLQAERVKILQMTKTTAGG